MNANAPATLDDGCNSAGRLAGSSPTKAIADTLANELLSSHTSYEVLEQQNSLRRLPSPGRLWSDSEEVSEDDVPEKDQQSSRRASTQTPGSVCDSELEDHGYRSASTRSPDFAQSSNALQVGRTDPEMADLAQFIGYSESEFEEESDKEPQSLRPRSHRHSKLQSSNTSKTTSDVHSNPNKFTQRTGRPVAHIQKKPPVVSNASKGKSNGKNSKPAPFVLSSSSEDEERSGGEGFEDEEALHEPSSPPQQTLSQARPQVSPLQSRQTPVQTLSSKTLPRVPLQDAAARDPNAALRDRLQKALAKKGISSKSNSHGNTIAKNGSSTLRNLGSESVQVVKSISRPTTGGARSANATAQADRLLSNNSPQNTSSSTTVKQGIQRQKSQNASRTRMQASRVGAVQSSMANRPPAYGPLNISQQKHTGRQKQSAPAPPLPKLDDRLKTVDSSQVSKDKIARVPHPNVATSSAKTASNNGGRNVSALASSSPPSKPGSFTLAKPSALTTRPSSSSVTSRPTTPVRATQATPKTPLQLATGRDVPQAKPVNIQGTTTTDLPTNKQTQSKATSMITNEPRPVEATRAIQQHEKDVSGNANALNSLQIKSTVANPKAGDVNKSAQEAGVLSKGKSSSITPKRPAKRPAVSALQSILSEVSTGGATVAKTSGGRAQVSERRTVENNPSCQNVASVSTNTSTPAPPKGGLVESQWSSKNERSDTASRSAPVASTDGLNTLPPVQAQVPAPSVRKLPPPAQPQDSRSLATSATASISPPASPLATPKAPPDEASKLSVTQTQPLASIDKSASRSSNSTLAATRGHVKTHTRVPSGPTEDGFDIYIPPPPEIGKDTSMSTVADKVAAAPAGPNVLDREASEHVEKDAGENEIFSVEQNEPKPSSVPMTAPTNSTEVSTTAPIRRQSPFINKVASDAAAAPIPISRNGNGESALGGDSIVIKQPKPTVNNLFAKRPGNTAITTKPKDRLLLTHKTKPDEPTSQSLAITPQHAIVTERADSGSELPSIVLRDQPSTRPPSEPYFEYRIKQKTWPESGAEQDAHTLTVGFASTVLETANRQAEELFTQMKDQYLHSFPVQHQQSSSVHDDDGCLALTGTLATVGWPVKQINFKIWVERGEVPSHAVTLNPPPKFTPFISKTLYILRLYKLTDIPTAGSNEENQAQRETAGDADGSDEASGSDAGEAPSSSSSESNSSSSDSDPDKNKHNKKRQAEQALKGSPPSKRRKSSAASKPNTATKSAAPKRVIRQHHQIPCPEVYTTLYAANSAACDLQIDIMNEHTLLSQAAQASNAAALRRKLMELCEKERGQRYWHNEFAVGLVGAKMEIKVESVSVCGPRNV